MSVADDWAQCMRSNGMPVITLDDLSDVKEFIEEIHSAWENSGGDEEMTLAGLAALGAATGIDEGVLTALAAAGAVTVVAYIAGCISCLASAGLDALKDLFAESPPQSFMSDQLASLGVSVGDTATA
jgi:hypothetical protein